MHIFMVVDRDDLMSCSKTKIVFVNLSIYLSIDGAIDREFPKRGLHDGLKKIYIFLFIALNLIYFCLKTVFGDIKPNIKI